MTFADFLTKYNGKYIDFDGYYGAQCMDLMHQYCLEFLGISDHSVLAAPCAKDVYNNFSTIKGNELFEQIGNTPTGVPQDGDIMFWNTGTYGHVAIFLEGTISTFNSFDQNWPVGSPNHIQNHTYSNVLGWLRFKGLPVMDNQAMIDQLRAERDTNWNLYQAERNAKIDLEDKLDAKNKANEILTKMVEDKDTEIISLQGAIQELEDTVRKLNEDKITTHADLIKMTMDLEICMAQRKEIGKYTTKELWNEIVKRMLRR